MTHIAKCIRSSVMDRSQMHITDEPPSAAKSEEPERPESRTGRPESRTGLERTLSRRGQPRYQLWPSNKSAVIHTRSQYPSEKQMALSVQRSATAMGDAIVTNEGCAPRSRTGSLSRRRKVSVPELQAAHPMTTLQEGFIDSPTIPGRPPLQRPPVSSVHERSGSAPASHWRANPFGDAMVSCITGPAFIALQKAILPNSQASDSSKHAANIGLPTLKPLSPILSPSATAVAKPELKVDTNMSYREEDDDKPPEVPPKSPSLYFKKSPSSRQQPRNDSGTACTPVNGMPAPLTIAGTLECHSPESLNKRKQPGGHARERSDQSIMDRGRPMGRTRRTHRSRTGSATSSSEKEGGDTWKLPTGVLSTEAPSRLSSPERKKLRQQAAGQTEKFEILTSRDVASLSKELRALDERCDYLRKTYKSLRAGRQKLHSRMIASLKRGETVIFSRESLLKQEEALIELDLSIDDWMLKIEQAENRRLRIRQKLLEHVAAAMTLPPVVQPNEAAEATPPRSPIKEEDVESPNRVDRKDVESIRIYADGHVLNLFLDIEQAIGKMCEAC